MAVARTGRTSLRASIGELLVGTDANGVVGKGTLRIDAGTMLTLDSANNSVEPYFAIGDKVGSDGIATLAGAGTQVVLKGSGLPSNKPSVAVGHRGSGFLTISQDALLRLEGTAKDGDITDLVVGGRQGGHGRLVLDDGRVAIQADRLKVEVAAGDWAQDIPGGTGSAVLKNGSAMVLQGTSSESFGVLLVGDAGGTGTLSVAASTVIMRNLENAHLGVGSGRKELAGTGTVSVSQGGVVDVQATSFASLDVGDGGSGRLTVSGLGSLFSFKSGGTAAFDLGSRYSDEGGNGRVTVANGASMLIQGKYTEAFIGSDAGGSGLLQIISGGKVRIAQTAAFDPTQSFFGSVVVRSYESALKAQVYVDGAGSLLDLGLHQLIVGGDLFWSSSEKALINVRNGGELRGNLIHVSSQGIIVSGGDAAGDKGGVITADLEMGGTLRLLSTGGPLNINGNVEFASPSRIEFQVNSTGANHGRLIADEIASLAAKLIIKPLGGYTFAAGQRLTLITNESAETFPCYGLLNVNAPNILGQTREFGYILSLNEKFIQFHALNDGASGGTAILDFGQASLNKATFSYSTRTETGKGSGGSWDFLEGRQIDQISGTAARDSFVLSGIRGMLLNGRGGADKLTGGGGVDKLYGGLGNDVLDGGAAGDVLRGEAGSDTYHVGSTADQVFEASDGGIDTVIASIDFNLAALVNGARQFAENVILAGSAVSASGDGFANTLVGNWKANTLKGGGGDDILRDGTYTDRAVDTLVGGLGNDTFVVNGGVDKILEARNAGTDTVITSISFSLAAEVDGAKQYIEHLVLLPYARSGTGNDLANTLTGSRSDNVLSGGGGADTLLGNAGHDRLDGGALGDVLKGGAGDDLFVVDDPSDQVIEVTDSGYDTVHSSIDFDLSAPVNGFAQFAEYLVLTGSAVTGVGNGLQNTLTGNASENSLSGRGGMDYLRGNEGADILSGGLGSDTFALHLGHSGLTETTADRVTDWVAGDAIDVWVEPGWAANYWEGATTATTISEALAAAEAANTAQVDYIFLFNANSGTGYLITDLNNDETFETGVTLIGAGSADSFSALHII